MSVHHSAWIRGSSNGAHSVQNAWVRIMPKLETSSNWIESIIWLNLQLSSFKYYFCNLSKLPKLKTRKEETIEFRTHFYYFIPRYP